MIEIMKYLDKKNNVEEENTYAEVFLVLFITGMLIALVGMLLGFL